MKISIEWLKDYIEISNDVKKVAEELTMSGSEVEEIEKPFENVKNLFSARIVDVKPHPNADNLNVCKVYDGSIEYTVVTADKSVKVGELVIFGAANHACDFNGKSVQSMDIRGVKTDGMLFSLEELGLEAHSNKVFRFDKEIELGKDIVDLFGLDSTTLELEITPNRPDCLSHIGIAREISVIEGKKLKIPSPEVKFIPDNVNLSIESEGCFRYMGIRIDDVEVKESPLWMKKRLASIGLRSINNIADATNYVMMEFGHPIHAFDFDKIKSHKIIIRDAKLSENFTALNSKIYTFKGGEILIADVEKPLAIAGIIGGIESGINLSTKRILLEIATFDPVRIRNTSKGLNISTDASYRFERGVDPNDSVRVAKRLVDLIISIANGTVAGFSDLYPHHIEEKEVTLTNKKLFSYLSFEPENEDVEKIFNGLEMKCFSGSDGWKVKVPTFRQDISQDVDLIEEFARLKGYDSLPSKRSIPFVEGEGNKWWDFKSEIKRLVLSLGYFEAINYSFEDPKFYQFFGKTFKKGPELLNPISPEMSLMRSSLIYGLMNSLAYNVKHQEFDVKFFELGKVFGEDGEDEKIAFVSTGKLEPFDYTDKREVSLLNLKGDIEAIADFKHSNFEFVNETLDGFAIGRSGLIKINNKNCGIIGEIDEKVLDFLDLKVPVFAAEIDLKALFNSFEKVGYKPYSQYPITFRDLSMFVKKGKILSSEIIEVARASSKYVEDVKVLDLYTGKGVPSGSYSLTLRIIYGSMDRTLSDSEIDGAFNSLMNSLEAKEGITLRKVQK